MLKNVRASRPMEECVEQFIHSNFYSYKIFNMWAEFEVTGKNKTHESWKKNVNLCVEIFTNRKIFTNPFSVCKVTEKIFTNVYWYKQIQWQLQTCNPTVTLIYFLESILQSNHKFVITTSQISHCNFTNVLYRITKWQICTP